MSELRAINSHWFLFSIPKSSVKEIDSLQNIFLARLTDVFGSVAAAHMLGTGFGVCSYNIDYMANIPESLVESSFMKRSLGLEPSDTIVEDGYYLMLIYMVSLSGYIKLLKFIDGFGTARVGDMGILRVENYE